LGFNFYVVFFGLLVGLPFFAITGVITRQSAWKTAAMGAIGLGAGLCLVAIPMLVAVFLGPPLVGLLFAGGSGAHGYALGVAVTGGLGALFTALLLPWLFGLFVWAESGLGGFATFVGSLAGIDDFQTFIRFRLRRYPDGRSTLTGFVIAVTHTVSALTLLRGPNDTRGQVPPAALIDVFELESPAETGGGGRPVDSQSG
jgi:hypothetical protein